MYDPIDASWQRFSEPLEVCTADSPDEVLTILEHVESECRSGRYAVGFVTYEGASAFDKSLQHHRQGSQPLAAFAIFDAAQPASLPDQSAYLSLSPVISWLDYEQKIDSIKDYLQQGDSYQVNFTHRLTGSTDADPLAIFSGMSHAQRDAYSVYLETDDYCICSVSPELFFERIDDCIATQPMKGTRGRGRFAEEDASLRAELKSSAKDQAENLMIVDMVRNDLGRIAEPGTVSTHDMFAIKRYETVWQQVSSVSAKTAAPLAEIFTALFPCASVTGAPKTRTMQIIRELEAGPRGVYTGAIGVVKPGGDARFSVAIRTLVIDKKNGDAIYGVGGGIIWDSDAADEWQESLTKSEVLNDRRPVFQLLETMRYEPGPGVFLREHHLDRLRQSANFFGFKCDLAQANEVLDSIESPELIRVRMLLDRQGNFSIEQLPIPQSSGPVKLKLASSPICSEDTFLFHKTTHRTMYEKAKADSGECDDVILWNEAQELTETTISNLYLEIDGKLLTPIQESGLLAGTYRQWMLDEGRAKPARLVKSDLARASKIYVSNSVRLLQEAILVE